MLKAWNTVWFACLQKKVSHTFQIWTNRNALAKKGRLWNWNACMFSEHQPTTVLCILVCSWNTLKAKQKRRPAEPRSSFRSCPTLLPLLLWNRTVTTECCSFRGDHQKQKQWQMIFYVVVFNRNIVMAHGTDPMPICAKERHGIFFLSFAMNTFFNFLTCPFPKDLRRLRRKQAILDSYVSLFSIDCRRH